jgi:hypothetical protein
MISQKKTADNETERKNFNFHAIYTAGSKKNPAQYDTGQDNRIRDYISWITLTLMVPSIFGTEEILSLVETRT